ncbi:60S ribosomal protein L27, mitochondrial [Coemansia sp. RSA 989]|nr:mitochondrial ribosomal protein L27-domain-containing protein [Coemansia mojavensis]KAJ1740336.1 60S ribosomal protein L27, mitochondrial [Coemansia sp. RSA 1086]KAJ1867285.1 60S ribosomal protein L27, mitochondrial [Coemansia sp. RSA 989]KAJ1874853.1 60S ribosomal protein L27, mitochondrial [Coemansia sp. RSA 990]KAJ2650841.1 60S ribosomal protein L27, mitochondrial [Coemansia sp. RSA 1250]KAJ2672308.1 60S ribosomal protein L27, mitochondrial [Coemansia sp. RSA 1085]
MQEVVRGLFRGAKRGVMTSKQGRNFYKGNRTGSMGRHTKHGGYAIDWNKVRTFVVPNLHACELKPYVSHRSDKFKVDPPSPSMFTSHEKQ